MKNKNNVNNPINLPFLLLGFATVITWVLVLAFYPR
jgi:hypothetical protein